MKPNNVALSGAFSGALCVIAATVGPMSAFAADQGMTVAQMRVEHIRAIDMAMAGRNQAAIQALESILDRAPKGPEKDRVLMSLGRVRFQDGDDQGAIDAYEQVESRGPSWLEALGERAWAEMRLNRPQEAIAKLETVTSPAFKEMTRTEPYFLLSLAQLRVCDYKNLFKTFANFKKRYKEPITRWENEPTPENKLRLKEAAETIQKMNLVEAEAIQRLYIEEDGSKGGKVPKIVKSPGQLTFPKVEGEEVWVDELEGHRVAVRGCPNVTAEDTVAAQLARDEKR